MASQPPLFHVRDQRRQGWFSVDNEIVDNYAGQIGAYGVAVYCVLCRHVRNESQQVKLSARDIGATLGISHDRVRKSLANLVEVELIHHAVPERPGPGLISTITLLDAKTTGRHTSSTPRITGRVASSPVVELDATRPRNKEEKTKTKSETKTQLPPTPLFERGVSDIWQEVCGYLKDDLSTAYVNNQHFQELAYDKYFRDCCLVEIRDGIAFLASPDSVVLREGVEKFQKRLRLTFKGAGIDLYAVRVKEPTLWTREASA